MADRQWYTGRDGRQEGPFSDERLRELIASGAVRGDTLVWSDGMANWVRAADVPGLMPAGYARGATAISDAPVGPLSLEVGVWGLFWRAIVMALAQLLVIPYPWIATMFLRWFVEGIKLPGGRRVALAGKVEDVWWVFMLYALCPLATLAVIAYHPSGGWPVLVSFLSILFGWMIVRWVFANLVWEGQREPLRFTGQYWTLVGWFVLYIFSIFTIIGWAWVVTATARWMCRRVEGSSRKLLFTGSGWGFLWRSLVVYFTAFLIIPIPWTMWWLTRWLISHVVLAERDRV
jgi:GYF domain 2